MNNNKYASSKKTTKRELSEYSAYKNSNRRSTAPIGHGKKRREHRYGKSSMNFSGAGNISESFNASSVRENEGSDIIS